MLIFAGIIIGGCAVYLFLRPRLNKIENDNSSILKEIEEQERKKRIIETETTEASYKLQNLKDAIATSAVTFQQMNEALDNLNKSLSKQKESFANHMQSFKETEKAKFEEAKEKCKEEYLQILKDCKVTFIDEQKLLETEKENLLKTIENLESIAKAAIADNKRVEEKKLSQNFYKINISLEDLEDVNKLREISNLIHNKEILNKLVWKEYFERPTNELLQRLLNGKVRKIGIYKITHIDSQKVYIGQSVDINSRLITHIKAGLGIRTLNNKLYSAMQSFGVENFTFEILEECTRDRLNEKEAYWINYFDSYNWGWNSTKGNN